MDNYRTRICICYLISAVLIGVFIYTFISINMKNMKALERLREEVDELANVVLNANTNSNTNPEPNGESKQISDAVDTAVKKRLTGIWDDLYSVKKQIKNTDCMSAMKQREAPTDDPNVITRVNYASDKLGAKIHSVIAVPVGGTNIIKQLLRLDFSANPPVNMIMWSMEPGSCFAFKDSQADVIIKLAKEIVIEAVEIAHIPKNLAPAGDISSAPRLFSVYGVHKDLSLGKMLGSFEYTTAQQVQQYPIKAEERFAYICFKFEQNHGNPYYTCVYRVAVYGRMD